METRDKLYMSIWEEDRKECDIPLSHISDEIKETPLREVDELFGAADILSIRNAGRHRRILLALSAAGTLLTLFFLLYDEAEAHGLILACGVMVVCLFCIRRFADRMDCHRKYIEYRVLAECLRCQFFLFFAGLGTRVTDILPWTIRQDVPWIRDVLSALPEDSPMEKHSILDCWIRDQKAYHASALKKAEIKDRRDRRISTAVLVLTVIVYCAALIYELAVYRHAAGTGNADVIRAVLKIVLGTMSAATLFTGNYYGKMSVSSAVDDHRRMIALYEEAEKEIVENGESSVGSLFHFFAMFAILLANVFNLSHDCGNSKTGRSEK